LGFGRLYPAVQTAGAREIPVAQKKRRDVESESPAVPVATGRPEHPPAQGAQACRKHRLFLAANQG